MPIKSAFSLFGEDRLDTKAEKLFILLL